ncbi:MAG: V-type ATP synthase subunit F [Nitrososphaerales archaeon]
MSARSIAHSGKIAVVGERELVLGYRLLGVEDAFIASKEDAQKTVMDLFNSSNYGLIIVSASVRKVLSNSAKEKLESSIIPLVIFMPSLDSKEQEEESLSLLARRVLGVDMKVNG